jgi:hypothetical protein
METLKLYAVPLFPDGFDMRLLPSFLSLLSGATLKERSHDIVADITDGAFDLRLDLRADAKHPFEYREVGGHKIAVAGIIAEASVTASLDGTTYKALEATGLHAPVADFLKDLTAGQSQEALVDLAEPGPIEVKPAGVTGGGLGGDTLYVPGVHALFDLRGVPGHEVVELKPGDKIEVSDEQFHNVNALRHDLVSDGSGGWLLAAQGDTVNSIDLQLASGHPLTKAAALSLLMLDA